MVKYCGSKTTHTLDGGKSQAELRKSAVRNAGVNKLRMRTESYDNREIGGSSLAASRMKKLN